MSDSLWAMIAKELLSAEPRPDYKLQPDTGEEKKKREAERIEEGKKIQKWLDDARKERGGGYNNGLR